MQPYPTDLDVLRQFYQENLDNDSEQAYMVMPIDHKYVLGIGLSSRCNFRCAMCYYHQQSDKWTEQDMPLPLLKHILDRLPTLANITIGLEGEPFCYPWLFEALDMMRPKADSFTFISNGSLVTADVCQRIKEYSVKFFGLSIDAADSNSYAKFRRGGNLAKFKRNSIRLAQALGDAVCLHTVIFNENLHIIPNMPRLAAEMDIGSISFQQFRPHTGATARGIHLAKTENMLQCLDKLAEEAQKHRISLTFNAYFGNVEINRHLDMLATRNQFIKVPKTQEVCPYILSFTSILSDGRIFPCCGDFKAQYLDEYSFDSLFNHPYLLYLRACHDKGCLPKVCLKCRWSYHY